MKTAFIRTAFIPLKKVISFKWSKIFKGENRQPTLLYPSPEFIAFKKPHSGIGSSEKSLSTSFKDTECEWFDFALVSLQAI